MFCIIYDAKGYGDTYKIDAVVCTIALTLNCCCLGAQVAGGQLGEENAPNVLVMLLGLWILWTCKALIYSKKRLADMAKVTLGIQYKDLQSGKSNIARPGLTSIRRGINIFNFPL